MVWPIGVPWQHLGPPPKVEPEPEVRSCNTSTVVLKNFHESLSKRIATELRFFLLLFLPRPLNTREAINFRCVYPQVP